MSAVESSEDVRVVFANPAGWRPTRWIAAAGHGLHLQFCAAHGWAVALDVVEGSSPYHIAAAAIGRLLVIAKSAVERGIKRAGKRHCGCGEAAVTFGNTVANSTTHSGNAQAAIVARSKSQNGA